MSKSSKKTTVTISADTLKKAARKFADLANDEKPVLSIIDAKIKDGQCHYLYEIITGKAKGFIHQVKGLGLIDDDMRVAFSRLNVHLAVLDDVFKHSDIQIADVDKMHTDELTQLYMVNGFKVKGGDENESVILIGNKHLSYGARMEMESPKVSIESTSSYKWYNELKTASDACRDEVLQYHYGKYTPIKIEEQTEDPDQIKMTFEKPLTDGEEQHDEEFANAKV